MRRPHQFSEGSLVEEPSSQIPTPPSAATTSSSSAPAPTAPQKDFWDKLGALTVLISSVVIGAAGVAATYVYNNHELEIKHEEKEAEEKRLQAQAEISRQIETNRRLEALFKYVSSDKDNEREFGYAMFQALGQEALAVKIIASRKDTAGAAVVRNATASTDPEVAKQAELASAQLSLRFWLFDPETHQINAEIENALLQWLHTNTNSALHGMTVDSFGYAASAEDMLRAVSDLNIPKIMGLGSRCIVGSRSAPRSTRDMGSQYPVGSLCTNANPSGPSAPREWGTVYE